MLTMQEVKEWTLHPTTEAVFKELNLMIDEITEEVLHGGTLNFESTQETAMKTSFKLGVIEGIQRITLIQGEEDE